MRKEKYLYPQYYSFNIYYNHFGFRISTIQLWCMPSEEIGVKFPISNPKMVRLLNKKNKDNRYKYYSKYGCSIEKRRIED